MKKIALTCFIVACLLVCVIPFAAMVATGPSGAVGNEQPTAPPSATNEDGSPNVRYASQLGNYFEHNFAFRPEAMTLDAFIQAQLFQGSNIDSVVVGKDGWLYYASTLDDYLGRNTLTPRQANGVAHNLELIQNRVEQTGSHFVFTIAPNKNTLYPQNMPGYYAFKESDIHTRDVLDRALGQSAVNYCNLFEVLGEQDEVLYHAQDSHWNNKGALLAYQHLMEALGREPEVYANEEPEYRIDFNGDLAAMLYPAAVPVEGEYHYSVSELFAELSNSASVEDATIRTVDPEASGSLYMYRDSFGNALVPFFATSFDRGFFTKSFPMMLDLGLQANEPTDVVFEIAERNARWFITTPPIMAAPRVPYQGRIHGVGAHANVQARICPYSPLYLELSGVIDTAQVGEDKSIYIYVESESGNSGLFECFDWLSEDGEDGFLAYLPTTEFDADSPLNVSVMIAAENGYKVLGSITVTARSDEHDED